MKPHLHGSSGLFPPSTPEKQRKEICCQWQLVGVTGLEPVQYFYPQILSLLSMPIRLYPHMAGVVWIEHTMQESKSCALTAWLHSYINPAALQAALAYLQGKTHTNHCDTGLLVLVVGLEPTRYYYQQILSLPRLPIPSYQHIVRNYLTHNYLRLRIVD